MYLGIYVHATRLAGGGVVQELHVSEGEVAALAVELALPLAVHVHLYHLNDIPLLQLERRLVVGVGHARLPHARHRRQRALQVGVWRELGRAGRVPQLRLGLRRRERRARCVQDPLHVGHGNGTGAAVRVPRRPPLLLVAVDHHQPLAAPERQVVRVTAIKVELRDHQLQDLVGLRGGRGGGPRARLGQRPHQGRRVQVVEPVEGQQRGHIGEQLVPDAVADCAVGGHHAVYYVVGDAVVLSDAEHIVALYSLGVPDEEHTTLGLVEKEPRRFCSRQLAEIPTGHVIGVEGDPKPRVRHAAAGSSIRR